MDAWEIPVGDEQLPGQGAIAAALLDDLTQEGEWVGDRMDAAMALFSEEEYGVILEGLRRVAGEEE